MKTSPITLIIAEDHAPLRECLVAMLKRFNQFTVIGEAGDGLQLLEQVTLHPPHIVLIDIHMPRMNGIEAATRIHKQFPLIGIIAYSMLLEPLAVQKMIRAGAKGYLLKAASIQEILKAIQEVYKGRTYYCTEVLPFVQ